MSKRRKRRKPRPDKSSPPTKRRILLDRFSQTSLHESRRHHKAEHDYPILLYFDLEGQRATHRKQLHEALLGATIRFSFRNWTRVVDYRYTLHPLSAVGSLKGIGGRFNIGEHVDLASLTPFPALYLGDRGRTALAEHFQSDASKPNGLTREDFALTNSNSYSVVKLRGRLTSVFDLRKKSNLKLFVDITKHFTISARVTKRAKDAGIEPSKIANTVKVLHHLLMEQRWRFQPMHYDVPSNPQIFGELLCQAGIQGIVYPSTRASGVCLAVFSINLTGPDVYVEVVPPVPAKLELARLDRTTWRELIRE